MLGKARVAPEALDEVAPHHPPGGGVGVETAGVAVVADVGTTGIGELEVGALEGAVIDGPRPDGVDLDRLLTGVDDVDVVDQHVRDGNIGPAGVDRVVVGTAQGEVGDGGVGRLDAHQFAGDVAAVENHRLTVAAHRAQGEARSREDERWVESPPLMS